MPLVLWGQGFGPAAGLLPGAAFDGIPLLTRNLRRLQAARKGGCSAEAPAPQGLHYSIAAIASTAKIPSSEATPSTGIIVSGGIARTLRASSPALSDTA